MVWAIEVDFVANIPSPSAIMAFLAVVMQLSAFLAAFNQIRIKCHMLELGRQVATLIHIFSLISFHLLLFLFGFGLLGHGVDLHRAVRSGFGFRFFFGLDGGHDYILVADMDDIPVLDAHLGEQD